MDMKIKTRFILLLMMFTMVVGSANASETADQLMTRVATAVRGAKSITATFSISGSGGNMSGTYAAAGKKFAVVTNAASTWYNGSKMYTYNPRTNETTLVVPTASEVAESNPFSIISSMATTFKAAYAKSQPAGTKVLVLLPKKSGSKIKKVVLTLDAKRATPLKVVITDGSGTTTVTVSKFAANTNVPASTFEYPKAKYPKAKIVDLS